MNKPKIIAYLKPSCGWSQGVRAIMRKYDLPFEDRDIINDPRQRQEMIEKSGQMLSPCVEVNGKMLPDKIAYISLGLFSRTAPAELEDEFKRLLQEHPSAVVFDLRGLDFLDSTGLRLILGADSRARREGRRVVIVPGPEKVHRVFRITLLDRRLEFADSPEAAREDGTDA